MGVARYGMGILISDIEKDMTAKSLHDHYVNAVLKDCINITVWWQIIWGTKVWKIEYILPNGIVVLQ